MIIEAENLSKRFGRHRAVDGLDLAVPKGAALALVGANGAGKTTTLRLLLDVLRADSGAARIMGVDSRRLTPADFTRIAYVSENQKLPTGLTVAQFFNYLRPLYPNWDTALEAELREALDLPAGRRIGKLSHGMRIKAALASALAFRPEVLILDEPLSGLDPLVREEVLERLLAQAGEMTVLISSHELAEIEGFATHVAYMEKGRITLNEPMDTLIGRFRAVSVSLTGEAPRPDASWLNVKASGRLLTFIESDYRNDAALARKIGTAERIDAIPLSFPDISKALIRAGRKEIRQ